MRNKANTLKDEKKIAEEVFEMRQKLANETLSLT